MKRCKKIGYETKDKAKQAGKRHGNYTRVYYCNFCQIWHLTSEKLKDWKEKNRG